MLNKHNAQRANIIISFGAKMSNAMNNKITNRLIIFIQINC